MRIRQHVNPLADRFQRFTGDAPVIAAGDTVELEIGCADAQFLFERAQLEPQRRYIGLEIREDLVHRVNHRAKLEGAPVQAVFCNVNAHLDDLFAPRSVQRVYLNFPDPCFKKRHRKRRMIDRELGAGIHRLLAPGGELFFQSDVWDVALDAMEVFEGLDDRFVNRAGAWSFWKEGNPFGARSWREVSVEGQGLPVWRIWYRPAVLGE